jgi:hypothetical protein
MRTLAALFLFASVCVAAQDVHTDVDPSLSQDVVHLHSRKPRHHTSKLPVKGIRGGMLLRTIHKGKRFHQTRDFQEKRDK